MFFYFLFFFNILYLAKWVDFILFFFLHFFSPGIEVHHHVTAIQHPWLVSENSSVWKTVQDVTRASTRGRSGMIFVAWKAAFHRKSVFYFWFRSTLSLGFFYCAKPLRASPSLTELCVDWYVLCLTLFPHAARDKSWSPVIFSLSGFD